MGLGDLATWFAVAVALAALGHSIFVSKRDKSDKKIAALHTRVDGKADLQATQLALGKIDLAEDRLTRLESDMRHLPDRQTTHRLELSLRDLSSKVEVLSERIKPIGAISDRLQEAIIERAAMDRGAG